MNPTGNHPVIWNPPPRAGWWKVKITNESAAVPVRSFELTIAATAAAGPSWTTGTVGGD